MAKRGSRRKGARSTGRTGPTGWKRWLRRLFVWGGALALLGALFLGLAVAFAARSLPTYSELRASQTAQTIVVRARDGTEIVELGPSYGKWLDSDEIPQVMKDAMISVEDRRYYSHPGIDPYGLARAFWVAMTGDGRISATSTITQQLARNIFLNSNRTLDRKLREAVLALALEWKFSKEQILELYLNKVYFGGGAYGVDSASRKFFSHPATELSTAEAAIIAGLVKAPSRYSPTADVDAAVGRANVVLRLMREQGRISASEASVDPSAVKLKEDRGQNSVRYFTDWALPQLDLLLPETFEPIEVWTTIDVGMQRAATAAIKSNTPGGAQGALVSLDRDGAILAMVGGTDYVTTNYNRATDAVRQPGSAWKLFVYLSALEAGYTPEDRVVDAPVTIDGWSPRNSGGNFAGEIDLRTAFAYSKNTVAAQLGNEVGFGTVASMARRFGITTPISTYPAMVLGSSEVRVIDMTRAFAAISAGGNSVEPYGIVKVTTASGETLYSHDPPPSTPLVPDYVTAGITDLLQTTVNTGTGRAAQIGRPVAGKTGTTNSNKDGWFLGFSSGITTGVWMGRDDARAVPGLQGGRAPAQAFAAYMRYAVRDRPVEQFDTELQLPEWQLEPDDEYYYGDPDDYYYIDEQGNLIEPGRRQEPGEFPFPIEGETPPADRSRQEDAGEPERETPPGGAGQAASDDFLDRATGRAEPQGRAAPQPSRATPRPAPTPQPLRLPPAPTAD
ncbi:transglycosylase domain-containing protein [Pelagerythrobacter marinus]|uniref:peptidoglycan glycosyltransferase n=1 Tax=Pelagerythrobacter marinus TaxID=538382 RepID=A0ABW9UZT5_9SPHN|nr:PBP1A family penicillin-binding protein [Pelagerythrobacter marinus]MXO69419.1 PBP1A family penicillin-binding protein [Pelagerythrobacter marinus]USA39495.1 PBP1A family penicillin-binding protein [Pelagerythrobacter marinus]WPZ06365.1 PBP1A family penicillin-binding protein [Pelagerythrobacter marinus]